ncbi:hypothetical protein [Streptomyces axinellae]|uniref:Uncharacterized protein n=1 Tax=Streptomyces axinellae TaxID=552788 RepID=A0ABN3Q7J3_9ACTN
MPVDYSTQDVINALKIDYNLQQIGVPGTPAYRIGELELHPMEGNVSVPGNTVLLKNALENWCFKGRVMTSPAEFIDASAALAAVDGMLTDGGSLRASPQAASRAYMRNAAYHKIYLVRPVDPQFTGLDMSVFDRANDPRVQPQVRARGYRSGASQHTLPSLNSALQGPVGPPPPMSPSVAAAARAAALPQTFVGIPFPVPSSNQRPPQSPPSPSQGTAHPPGAAPRPPEGDGRGRGRGGRS